MSARRRRPFDAATAGATTSEFGLRAAVFMPTGAWRHIHHSALQRLARLSPPPPTISESDGERVRQSV
jgi:hypothetical protein